MDWIIIAGIVWLVYKAYDIDMRLRILDIRHRIMEVLVRSDNEADLKWLYDHHFGELYVGDYNRIVKFGRKHKLNLPLLTMEEEREREQKEKTAKGN